MIQSSAYRKLARSLLLFGMIFLLLSPLLSASHASQTDYYVDGIDGSDANSGTSQANAWRTFASLYARNFQPGDTIHLRCGSVWDGGLIIGDSGTEEAPITFKSYGSGAKPTVRNPGTTWGRAVQVDGDWVVVEGLLARDAHEAGILISSGADHNVVRDCEATSVGIGIAVNGQHNLITRNYAHDLTMITNTPGGDDDYGAVGVWLFNSSNEISHNAMVNCSAPSYDYGTDGGALEWYGDNVDNCYVHHNWATGCDGFLEVGGGSVKHSTIAYNVSVNNRSFACWHLSDSFGADIEDFRVEQNTIVESEDRDEMGWVMLNFGGSSTADQFLIRNNTFYVKDLRFVADADRRGGDFTHEHNLYYLASPETELGFVLGQGERVGDPLFVDLAGQDFHLEPESPAIDTGTELGYPVDYDGNAVPLGAAPDTGAYEYYAAGAPSTTPTDIPTPTNTPTPTATSLPPTSTPMPTAVPGEIVIDDDDGGFSTSYSQDPWVQYTQVGGQHYGDTHYYNRQMGSGQDIATWSFAVPTPGIYNVYAWWWEGIWRPTEVPYTIHHLDESTTVSVNQQSSGGQWNLLGAFGFEDQGSVTLSDNASSDQTDIVADAIRLTYVGPLPTPTGTPVPTSTPTPDQLKVTDINPNHGPASGGTSVTINGSGFGDGSAVTFGGVAGDILRVPSANEIVCAAPSHLPMVVDVIVTNTGGQSDTLSRGYTYEGAIATLSLPDSHSASAAIVQVPINVAGLQSLVAADLEITFDSDALSARGVSVGELTSGWSLATNVSTPGEIRLSLASTGTPASGEGTLAWLEFEVNGHQGAATALHLAGASLNNDTIPTELIDGSFLIDLVAVSGTVRYWSGNAGVPTVQLTTGDGEPCGDQTDASGAFAVVEPSGSNLHLHPSKSGDADAISAYDASLVLQHSAGIITLADHAAVAADVDENGTINAMDAFYILQKTVDLISLPFPGSRAVWSFDPAERSYTNLSENQSAQEFTAVLLGDVSGNWGSQDELSSITGSQAQATLSVVGGEVGPSGLATVTLRLDAGNAQVYSLDAVLAYSSNEATALSVDLGPLSGNLAMVNDLGEPGQVRVALAAGSPICDTIDLLTIRFQMADQSASGTRLLWTKGDVNEGSVPVYVCNGTLGHLEQIHLPIVVKG